MWIERDFLETKPVKGYTFFLFFLSNQYIENTMNFNTETQKTKYFNSYLVFSMSTNICSNLEEEEKMDGY